MPGVGADLGSGCGSAEGSAVADSLRKDETLWCCLRMIEAVSSFRSWCWEWSLCWIRRDKEGSQHKSLV